MPEAPNNIHPKRAINPHIKALSTVRVGGGLMYSAASSSPEWRSKQTDATYMKNEGSEHERFSQ